MRVPRKIRAAPRAAVTWIEPPPVQWQTLQGPAQSALDQKWAQDALSGDAAIALRHPHKSAP